MDILLALLTAFLGVFVAIFFANLALGFIKRMETKDKVNNGQIKKQRSYREFLITVAKFIVPGAILSGFLGDTNFDSLSERILVIILAAGIYFLLASVIYFLYRIAKRFFNG